MNNLTNDLLNVTKNEANFPVNMSTNIFMYELGDFLKNVEEKFEDARQEIERNYLNCEISKRQLENKIQEQTQELRLQILHDKLLSNLSQRIRQSLNLSDILNTTVNAVRQFLNCDRALIYKMFSDQNKGVIIAESSQSNIETFLQYEIDETKCNSQWHNQYITGKIRVVNDIYEENMSPCHLQLLEKFHIRAKLIVPLIQNINDGQSPDNQRIWGLLIATMTETPHEWKESEIELLSKLSTQLAMGIQQSELYERSQRQLREKQEAEAKLKIKAAQQEALAKISQEALANTNFSDLFQTTTQLVAKTLNLKYASLWELLSNHAIFSLRAGVGWKHGMVGRATVSAGNRSLPGYTLLYNKPLISNDLRLESRFSASQVIYQHSIVSSITVVIEGKDEPFGVLGAHAEENRDFTTDEINFLQSIANTLAMAIKRQQAEEEMNKFFNLSLDMLAIIDTNGYAKRLNPRFSETLGYSIAELKGSHLKEFVVDEDLEQFENNWKTLLIGMPVFDSETRYKCSDGSYRWLAWTAIPSTTEDNIYAVARDVTDRHLAEQELRESEELHRITLSSIADAVFITNDQGKFTFICPNINYIFGYTAQEIEQLGDIQHILGEGIFNPEVLNIQEKTMSIEREIKDKFGAAHFLLISIRQVAIKDGSFLFSCRDITDRKYAEQELRSSQERLQHLLTASPAMIYSRKTKEDFVATFFSDNVRQQIGYQPSSFYQPGFWLEHIHPEDRTQVIANLPRLFDQGYHLAEYRLQDHDGNYRWLHDEMKLVLDQANNSIEVVGSITDISNLKWATEQIHQQAERERLLNQMALKIRQSLDLTEILDTTVAEIRLLLKCDRVLFYQFDSNFDGKVVAESVADNISSILGFNIGDNCFSAGIFQDYITGKKVAINDIYAANLSECYINLLEKFTVKANLVVPILLPTSPVQKDTIETTNQNQLWGLLIAHHCQGAFIWQPEQLELMEKLAIQVAIAIQQSQLYRNLQIELVERLKAKAALEDVNIQLELRVNERTALLKNTNTRLEAEIIERKQAQESLQKEVLKSQLFTEIALKIRQSLDLQQILHTTVKELQKILNCDRIFVYRLNPDGSGNAIAEAVLDGWMPILNTSFSAEDFPLESHPQQENNLNFLEQVNQSYQSISTYLLDPANNCANCSLKNLQTLEFCQTWDVKAKLVVPILPNQLLWGLIIAHQCSYPRQWLEFEVELLQQLAVQVGVAISQSQLLEAQQQSEAKFRLMAENSTDMISRHTLDGVYLYASNACHHLLGYEPEELIGHSAYEFFHPEDINKINNSHNYIVEKTDIYTVTYRIICKDGHYIWFETTSRTVRNSNEEPIEIVAVSRDITDRKLAEIALQESQEFIQRITEASPNILYIYDVQENRNIYSNREIYTFLGYTPEQIESMGDQILSNLIDPEDMPKVREHHQRFSQSQEREVWEIEYRVIDARGNSHWFISRDTLFVRDAEGKPKQILGMAVDITERKLAEFQFKKSLQEKELLLKEIHHRVKNNLLVVSHLLEFQADYTSDPEIRKILADSQNRIYSMALIHEKLYRSTNLDKINFGSYLETLVENLCDSYRMNSQQLEFDFKIDPIEINIETAHPCGLIVNELVSNIFKHAFPDGRCGKIEIGFHQDQSGSIELIVKDNGIGLPENLDFRHTESLGMELVCTLTDQIKGEIKLARNEGTTFTLKFTELKYQKRW